MTAGCTRGVRQRGVGLGPAAAGRVFAVVVLLCSATCTRDANTLAPSGAGSGPALEQQVLAMVNDYRVSRGLAPLGWSDVIADQARQHSADMANGTASFGHDGASARWGAIAQAIPWASAAEVVAATPRRAAAAVVGEWLNSPEHRTYLEGDFQLAGVGVAQGPAYIYSTQILIKPR